MKTKSIILFMLLFLTLGAYSQKIGIIEYEYTFNQNLWKRPNSLPEFKAVTTAEQASLYAKEHKYFLKFNRDESFFYVEEEMDIDDVQDRMAFELSKMVFGKGIFYQNNINLYTLNEIESMNQEFLVKDTIVNNWTISYEKKYINGYKCYKATKNCNCGKDIVAWFTPDIPLPFGPAGYAGTPGLILELTFFKHTLTMKNFIENSKIIINKPNQGTPITLEELKELQWKKRMEIRKKHQD